MWINKCQMIGIAAFILVNSSVANGAELVIAQSAPLSGSVSETGRNLVLGTKIYLDYINEVEGGVNKNRLVHQVKDDGYKIEETLKNTKEFIADQRVIALTGYFGTDNVSELFKQGLFDSTPLCLVGASTGARLLREPLNPTIFHIRASYAQEVEAIVRHVANLGSKRIAVFYEDNPFGEAGLRVAEDVVKKRGLILVARASYEPYTTDVRNAVQDVIVSKPDTVVMIAMTAPAAEFAKQFREAGQYAFLFNISTANAEELAKLVKTSVLQGFGISQVVPYPYSATLPIVTEYQALMDKYAKGASYSYSSMEGFLNAKILVAALKKAGQNPSRASVKHALEAMGEVNFGGYIASFSPSRHVGSNFVDLTAVGRNGKLIR